jgi:N utilization substance protein B
MSSPSDAPPDKHDAILVPRRAARLAAVQALYQMAMTGAGADAVIREFLRHRLGTQAVRTSVGGADQALFAELVQGVAAAGDELDDMIAAVLTDQHDVDRLETVLKVVLRAGAFELANRLDVPAPVTINEYVELAEAFYDKKGTSLANAVLDRLARALRPEELEDRPGGRTPTAG